MALRDQPYLPLYIQDVLTDEKLIECSAEAHGIYFRLLCILHKQDKYGLLKMKQKYKQKSSKYENFACMLCKQMPFSKEQIQKSLYELDEEGVIIIDEDKLFQKRMVKDGEISLMRAVSGKKGGSNVTKQYNKKGYLYLMSDMFDKNKIGVSVNPQNRLYRLRSDLKLPKNFDIIESIEVDNMGESEDMAFDFFGEKMDGEWIKDDYNNIIKDFVLFKAKLKANIKAKNKANTEYEYEYENINNSNINNWRKDYNIYITELNEKFEELKKDVEWLKKMQKIYPGIDIIKSMEQSIIKYWGTETGWKKKASARTKSIDWKKTFANTIEFNKVEKSKQQTFEAL